VPFVAALEVDRVLDGRGTRPVGLEAPLGTLRRERDARQRRVGSDREGERATLALDARVERQVLALERVGFAAGEQGPQPQLERRHVATQTPADEHGGCVLMVVC
jgi:hypothetical protein